MTGTLKVRVNERLRDIEAAPDAPRLYFLSGEVQMREFSPAPIRVLAALRHS
jgi:hypothetical protein